MERWWLRVAEVSRERLTVPGKRLPVGCIQHEAGAREEEIQVSDPMTKEVTFSTSWAGQRAPVKSEVLIVQELAREQGCKRLTGMTFALESTQSRGRNEAFGPSGIKTTFTGSFWLHIKVGEREERGQHREDRMSKKIHQLHLRG